MAVGSLPQKIAVGGYPANVIVVGQLLGTVPAEVAKNAQCDVLIVQTSDADGDPVTVQPGESDGNPVA